MGKELRELAVASSARTCRGDHLVPAVLSNVFDFLDFDVVFVCMQTCTRWRRIARDHPSFSTLVSLNALSPGHYSLFVTRLAHHHHRLGPLEIRLVLRAYLVLPTTLFDTLRRVWPRVRMFSIESEDVAGTLSFLTLPSPALTMIEIWLLLPGHAGEQPLLPTGFLGGHAPELRILAVQEIGLSRAALQLPALQHVQHFLSIAVTMDSLALVPLVFPHLETLRVFDPMIPVPAPQWRAHALHALDGIPNITIELRIAPEWIMHLLPVLPLATIQTLTLITTKDPRRETPPEAFGALLDSLPGDLDVSIRTADAPAARGGVNFIARAAGGRLVRKLALPDLQKFEVPDRVCARIAELEIHHPDWDRTCFWMYALTAIRTLRLVFHGRAALRALLRREKFRRQPVPVPCIAATQFVLHAEDGLPTDVDFGELYGFLRAGTVEPVIRGGERFQSAGMRVTGKASTATGEIRIGDYDPPSAEILDLVEATRVQMAEQIRTEGLYGFMGR